MPNVNMVILCGRLTRDPELKYSQSGTPFCKLNIAVNHKFKAGNDWKEEVLFAGVTSFGKSAEAQGKYLSKGSEVLVEGRLKLDQWQDKDGNKRSSMSVISTRVHFLGNKLKKEENENQSEAGAEEDIPF